MSGACPLWEEAVLLRDVCKAELNLLIYRRIYKVEEREECAECIPETGVGVEISVADLSVVRAVVYRLASLVEFVELAREEGRSVEARVECAVLVVAAASHLDASEDVVPSCLGSILHLCE